MNLFAHGVLLAQLKAREPKPGDWSFGWGAVGVIAAVAASIVLVTWLVIGLIQSRKRTTANSPWHLFKDLCSAHGLSVSERQSLVRLAKERDLGQPAMLFVEPACWELERASGSSRTAELERLKRRIFAAR